MYEIWKTVPGAETTHDVSNLGRVRSKTRLVFAGKRCGVRKALGKLLRPTMRPDGYLVVHLRCGGKGRSWLIHRLVATTFLPNPERLRCVNHLDFDKTNNAVHNLEWCTDQENQKYSREAGRIKPKPRRDDAPTAIPVEALDDEGNIVFRFGSQSSAADAMRTRYPKSNPAVICSSIAHKWKAYGYKWRRCL